MNDRHSPLCMCQACQDEAMAIEIRKDAETLRAVTAERDTLLRDCWEACGGKGPDSSDDELVGTISTMRVGLERWQKRACDAEAERDMDREMGARSKLDLIEANRQLDAIRARIEGAPRLNITDVGANSPGGRWIIRDTDMPESVRGHIVALVVIDQDDDAGAG